MAEPRNCRSDTTRRDAFFTIQVSADAGIYSRSCVRCDIELGKAVRGAIGAWTVVRGSMLVVRKWEQYWDHQTLPLDVACIIADASESTPLGTTTLSGSEEIPILNDVRVKHSNPLHSKRNI